MTSDIENRPFGSGSSSGSREDSPSLGASAGGSQSGFGQPGEGRAGEARAGAASGPSRSSGGSETGAGDVSKAVGREASSARAELSNATDQVKQGVASLGETAREKAAEGVEKGKAELASGLGDFAAAIRKASDELGERDQSMAAGLVREVANGLEQATGAIHGASVQDLARSVTAFARRQPTTFLIGAALAGVALGRFARASGEHVHPRSGRSGGVRDGGETGDTGFDRGAHGFGAGHDETQSRTSGLTPGRSAASTPVAPPVSGGTPAPRSATVSGSTSGSSGGTGGSGLSPSAAEGRNAPPPAGPVPPVEGPSGAVLGHGSGSFNPQGGHDVR